MKYLMDTALLVELLRPEPAPSVRQWYKGNYEEGLGLDALTLSRLYGGAAAMAPGAQRNLVTRWLSEVQDEFRYAVLSFSQACAGPCARLCALGLSVGRPVPLADAMTAAIAEANGLILAARTTPHLMLWGGPMVDPWRG